MKRPTEVDFSDRRIPDAIWEAIIDTLSAEFGADPSGFSIELKVVDIDWDEE